MRIAPIVAAALMIAAGAGTWVWVRDSGASPQEQARPAMGKGKRFAKSDDAVPVTVVPVALADVAVHREGIGNVQALAAIVVRAQVDGRLMSVEFAEGQDVEKGQVLARIDASVYQAQLDQASAKKAQNEAMLANARLDLERARKLTTLNAGAKKTEDTANAQVRQFEAQIRADEAVIDNARAVLGFTTITAPITGRAGLRMVDPGNLLRGDSTAIVSIMQTTPIGVVFTLPQRDLVVVSAAMARGSLSVEVLASDGTTVIANGKLSTIDNQIDQTTGTIKLKAEMANDGRRLWPGQFVSVRVVVDTLKGAKVVPTAAIRRGPPGTFVYVVDADSRARMTPVEVTLESDGRAIVAKGVEAGAQVVTVGFARLSDGKEVDVVAPADQASPRPVGEAGQKKKREGKRGASAGPSSEAGGATGSSAPSSAPAKGARP